jgi:hypothetical protein
MIARGFGGSERRIYTKELPELRDRITRVVGKRRVVTGDRYPGCGPGYYGDEAEGPSLENQKHHTLIALDLLASECLGLVMIAASTDSPLEIEQRFVEKVIDDGDGVE